MNRSILPYSLLLLPWLGLPARSGAPPGAAILTELEMRYAEDRAASLRLVLARYADELEALQQKLLEAGDTAGASRVLLERDRLVPALGLPAVAEEDADEFSLFEEMPAAVPSQIPAVPPSDLDAVLKTLLPPAAGSAASTGNDKLNLGTPSAGVPGRRIVRMSNAQLQGSYDPLHGYIYWSGGRTASWTLSDLAPGSYQLRLRYSADSRDGGGTLDVKFGSDSLSAEVPVTGNWKRRRDLVIGPFVIKEPRADLVLQVKTTRAGASYLMDLAGIVVMPATAAP